MLERAAGGSVQLVAYVATTGADLGADAIEQFVRAGMAPAEWPLSVVLVDGLPRDGSGRVNDEALREIAVVGPALIERWRGEAASIPGVRSVEVVDAEPGDPRPNLHLLDVGGDWHAGVAGDTATRSGTETAATPVDPQARLAIADGGPLQIGPDDPRTLSAALLRRVALTPHRQIVVVDGDASSQRFDYGTLLREALECLGGLQRAGVSRGSVLILQFDSLRDYLPAFWAAVLGGFRPMTVAIPAAYEPHNSVVQKLFHAWELTGRPTVLTTRAFVAPLESLSQSLPMNGLRVVPIEALRGGADGEAIERAPGDVAFLQLSSGSTGVSKCIQITDDGIVAHILGTRQRAGLAESDVTFNWLPMDHVAPLLMSHITDMYLGSEQVHAAGTLILSDPLRWLDLIDQYRVTHTWSPNFGLKMVLDALPRATRTWDLRSVKSWVNAGEQVTLPVMQAFTDALAPFGLDRGAVHPAYGMAETCTAIVYEAPFDIRNSVHIVARASLGGVLRPAVGDEETSTFVVCGPPSPGVRLRIVDRQNVIVPERVIGRVQVHGPVVTPGYLNNAAANQEALVGDGWLNTGDLGFLDSGRLTLTGREKELIIVRGANFYSHDLEETVSQVPGVLGTWVAACGVPDAESGSESLAIFCVADPDANVDRQEASRAVRRVLAERAGIVPSHLVWLTREQFPKTTSGKIQRGRLRERLLAGDFADELKQVDVWLENANTVPDWFHTPTWQRSTAPAGGRGLETIVLLAEGALADAVAERLAASGRHIVRVRRGPGYGGGEGRFEIEPANREQYARLFEECGLNKGPALVVHAWQCVPPTAGESSGTDAEEVRATTNDLLALVQALAAVHRDGARVRLLVASTGVQQVLASDLVRPARRPSVALLKAARQEFDWLEVSHVDLSGASPAEDAAALASECESGARDVEIAWRGDSRWVSRLERLDLVTERSPSAPFLHGGLYVMSGGTGGIGAEVARHLLVHYKATLLIVGRSPANAGSDGTVAAVLDEWRRLPGEVHYLQADICDAAAVQALVAGVCNALGRAVDGVIHLAGVYADRALVDERPETFEHTWRTKVAGAATLLRLIDGRPDATFVSCSSIGGYFGGYGAAAYASGNAFLEALAEWRRANGLNAVCVAFSLWDGIGMSHDFQGREAMRSRGYRVLERAQGVTSFFLAAGQRRAVASVGLDDRHRSIRGALVSRGVAAQHHVAWVDADDSFRAEGTVLRSLDAFGREATCVVRRSRQAGHAAPAGAPGEPDHVEPRTELEAAVRAVWRSVLNRDRVGIEDHFFDLGGTSLDLARLAGSLTSALGRRVSTTDIYQHPTVAAQAAFFGSGAATSAVPGQGESRGASRRALALSKAARRGPRADPGAAS